MVPPYLIEWVLDSTIITIYLYKQNMQYRQRIKEWINERQWINPYWSKISEHVGRIFLEQDLFVDSSQFKQAVGTYESIICEFGSGSGEHLIELAKKNPNRAVIGYELRLKRIVKTIEKAKKAGLDNAFVVFGYAQNAKEILNPGTISSIFINFPDPWEKNTKHRLINPQFLHELSHLMASKGVVNFKTDHTEYFQSAKEQILDSKDFDLLFATDDMYRDLPTEQIIPTEFEKLFLSQNLKISALAFTKN